MRDPKQTGDLAQAQFIVRALQEGWEIATPFSGCHAYDYLIRRNPLGLWETVQVKTAYMGRRNGGRAHDVLEVGFRRSRGPGSGMQPYKDGDFDLLFACEGADCWLIPWSAIRERKSVVQVGGLKYAQWKLL